MRRKPVKEETKSERILKDFRHCAEIAMRGRRSWQQEDHYGLRSLVETGIGRLKGLTGGSLRARTFGAQQKEVAIDISVLNRQIQAAKPVTIRVK